MKRTKTIFLAFSLALIASVNYAQGSTNPGPPTASKNASDPDAPPDIPIDQNLMVLSGCAVLFGMYSIYRYNEKKASI